MKDNNSYFYMDKVLVGYGKHIIVDDISIEIIPGEIVALIGPNGVGKSTILKSICNELSVLGGRVVLEEKEIASYGRAELATKMSALMTTRVIPERMNGYQMVSMGRYPYTDRLGILSETDKKIVYEALELVNGLELSEVDFNEMSDGQKQRILLARSIAQEPEFLILDEPTSFLDIKYKLELLEVIKRLAKQKNIAVFMSIHELDIANFVADRVICIKNRHIDKIGVSKQVLSEEYIKELFDIDEKIYASFLKTNDNTLFYEGNNSNEAGGGKIVNKNQKKLRMGITTGTCAALAAKACAIKYFSGEVVKSLNIITPSKESVAAEVFEYTSEACLNDAEIQETSDKLLEDTEVTSFYVIKDSGDDPDVTNHCKVCAYIEGYGSNICTEFNEDSNLSKYDKLIELSNDNKLFYDEAFPGIFLTGGKGIGVVTKNGLEQNIGYKAINKVPRKMIIEAVYSVAEELGKEDELISKPVLITIEIPEGEELAKKTFKSNLGIEGGLSILGTSGILEAMSEKAIIDTIEAQIRQQKALGYKDLLITPGLYGQSYVKKELKLPLDNAIKCSNYIGETIDLAVSYGFETMLLVGNLGKLIKLYSGIMNTHSRVADGRMEILCTLLGLCGANTKQIQAMHKATTTEDALDMLVEWDLKDEVLELLLEEIHNRVSKRAGDSLKIGIMIFSEKYGYLGETKYGSLCRSRTRGN